MSEMSKTPKIDKLNGTNYQSWKFKMRMVLVERGLWKIVSGAILEPSDESKRMEYTELQDRAFATLALNIADDQLHHIQNLDDNPMDAWNVLAEVHEPKGTVYVLHTLQELLHFKMDGSLDMQDHIDKFYNIVSRFRAVSNEPISETLLAMILLSSVSADYDNLIVALGMQTDTLTVDLVKTHLLTEAARRRNAPPTPANTALVVNTRPPSSKPRVKCDYCKRAGHSSDKCYKKAFDDRERTTQASASVAITDVEHMMAATTEPSLMNWLLDSGCSQHMVNDASLLSDTRSIPPKTVLVGNKATLPCTMAGTLLATTHLGKIQFRDVLYVPGLSHNLLSVYVLNTAGYSLTFEDHKVLIVNKAGALCLEAFGSNGLYAVKVRPVRTLLNTVSTSLIANVSSEPWHQRLGHIGESAMRKLVDSGRLPSQALSAIQNQVCQTCLAGKQSRLPFPTSATKSHTVLELLHMDLCGPISPASVSGAKYFLTIVDDYSRKYFVKFLSRKSDVFDVFVKLKIFLERQTVKKIKQLRSDNGGEFIPAKLVDLCTTEGIHQQFSVPETPQQNGVAERANRTITEKTRCMLLESGLPLSYWAEATSTAVYVYNRTPASAISFALPEERWSGADAHHQHLRVFGCLAHAHIPDSKRKKLDAKSQSCTFLGYCTDRKAYRLLSHNLQKVIFSRDVVFNETVFPGASTEPVGDGDSTSSELFIGERVESSPTASCSYESQCEADIPLPVASPESSCSESDNSCDVASDPSDSSEDPLLIQEQEYSCLAMTADPISYKQVETSDDCNKWEDAMDCEMESIQSNATWDLVELPRGRHAIGCKWVFRTKTNPDGSIARYKARLVAKGFSQKAGIDYDEIYSRVAKFTTLRTLLALAAKNDWELHQMDVKTAFLNGDLEEEIYMRQPEGRVVPGKEKLVCRLKKSLYGLKQAPRAWNAKLDSAMISFGFIRSENDPALYYILSGSEMLFVLVYVDDLSIVSNSVNRVHWFKEQMKSKFAMEDLGELKNILGFHVSRSRSERKLFVSQEKYVRSLLTKFNMEDCNPAPTPMYSDFNQLNSSNSRALPDCSRYASLVGSLMYAALGTRPDILFSVVALSRFNTKATEAHWTAAKRVLRYLKAHPQTGILYNTNTDFSCYSDADWATDHSDRKSIGGYCFMLCGGAISWKSKKQDTVALSSTEAEYLALSPAVKEIIWLDRLLVELSSAVPKPITLYEDNNACIALSKNPEFHERTKHIDIRFHFIRKHVSSGLLKLEHCSTKDMAADMLTKPLPRDQHQKLCTLMGLTVCSF